ncbi:MAG TPA: FimV/HubP family polar landmark protein [Pelomicrobium sp.]|nr:FimV/HubP family polar landmark protein [Pelomicrobium sp.]
MGALFLSAAGHAAGLGKLNLQSALGESLKAEIDIVALKPGELESLAARVATPETYKQANVEYQGAVATIRAKIESVGGRPVIRLSSTQPINEPFLNVLVELTWDQGSVLREYTLLLDPPTYTPPQAAAPVTKGAEAKSIEQQKPAAPAAAPAPAPAPAPAAKAAPAPGPAPAAYGATADTYGPVVRGDTLSGIAERIRHPGASLEQMLSALFRANPDAFVGNNMNRLKTGPVLKVPSRDEVMAIEQKEAVKEFRTQVADWQAYKQSLAGAATGGAPAAGADRTAAGTVTGAVAERGQGQQPPSEVLKLSKGEGANVANLQERIRSLEEENVAKEKALKEAQDRVAALEKNIQDMQKLIELKAQPPMAAPAKPAEPMAKPDAPKPAEPAPKPEAAAGPAPAPKPEAAPAPAAPPPAAAPAAPPAPKPAAPAPAVKPPAPKPPPPPEEPSLLDTLMEEPIYIAGLGALLVAMLGGGLYLARRKKQQAAEEWAAAEAELDAAATSPAESTPQMFAQPQTPETTAAGPGAMDEVDPVQEAEVYLTYRRDGQAEEVLKEALAKTPNRPEVYVKLLEIYGMRKDKASFETTARKLQAIAGGTPHWDKAVTMGLALDPTNSLYGGSQAGSADRESMDVTSPPTQFEPQSANVDFDLGGGGGESEVEDVTKWRPPSGLDTTNVDFEVTSGVGEGHHEEMKSASSLDQPLAFESGLTERSQTGDRKGPQESTTTKLDFDFSLDLGDAPAAGAQTGGDAQWQEIATKFDLAKAYKEMGDNDGAREILQEVMREGNAQQQKEAQELLDSL